MGVIVIINDLSFFFFHRTPLNAIIGSTSSLTDTELSYEQRGYVSTIEQSAEAQLSLINDLLDASRIQGTRVTAAYSAHTNAA